MRPDQGNNDIPTMQERREAALDRLRGRRRPRSRGRRRRSELINEYTEIAQAHANTMSQLNVDVPNRALPTLENPYGLPDFRESAGSVTMRTYTGTGTTEVPEMHTIGGASPDHIIIDSMTHAGHYHLGTPTDEGMWTKLSEPFFEHVTKPIEIDKILGVEIIELDDFVGERIPYSVGEFIPIEHIKVLPYNYNKEDLAHNNLNGILRADNVIRGISDDNADFQCLYFGSNSGWESITLYPEVERNHHWHMTDNKFKIKYKDENEEI